LLAVSDNEAQRPLYKASGAFWFLVAYFWVVVSFINILCILGLGRHTLSF